MSEGNEETGKGHTTWESCPTYSSHNIHPRPMHRKQALFAVF